MKIISATDYQKQIVTQLRLLVKKLKLGKCKFKSSGGKSEYITLMLDRNLEFSADLRNKALDIIYGKSFKRNTENPNAGNVSTYMIAMLAREWDKLLALYGLGTGKVESSFKITASEKQMILKRRQVKADDLQSKVENFIRDSLSGTDRKTNMKLMFDLVKDDFKNVNIKMFKKIWDDLVEDGYLVKTKDNKFIWEM